MTTLTPELIADRLVPSDPQLAPDGRSIAYCVAPAGGREAEPQSAIWLAAIGGTAAPRRLTAGLVNDTMPRWSPDGQALYFLSDRQKRGETQLYRLPLAGGEAVALTTRRGGVAAFAPLADGQTIALFAKDAPTAEEARRKEERDDANLWGERWPSRRLHLLDRETGVIRTPDVLNDRHIAAFAAAPDGARIAVTTWPNPELDNGAFPTPLHLIDVASGTAAHLCDLPTGGGNLTWDRSGDYIAYIARAAEGGASGNGLFLLRVDEAVPRRLVPKLTACPVSLTRQGTSPILLTVADGLDTTVQELDPTTGTLTERQRLPGDLNEPQISADGQRLAALRSTPREPLNLWTGAPGGPLIRLTDLNLSFGEIAWGTQERLAWQAADGLDLNGLLILPPGKERTDGPFLLIIVAHGGPYGRFADDFQLGSGRPSGQWLAVAGYAVLLPNPRGGVGHGNNFAEAVAGRGGLEDWDDIVAGLDRLIAERVADPDRLGIGGWSQGGFMTAWAVGQTERFRCGVMGAGVSDWGMMVAESDLPMFESGLGGSTGWEGIGPHPHDRVSPISFVHRVKTPVLMLHGERDERVPVSQAQFFARGLRHYGVANELVVYPREPHGLRERAHQIDATRRLRAWFDRWLGVSRES